MASDFVDFDWKVVGVLEERELLAGGFVPSDGFYFDALPPKAFGGNCDVVHLEGDMAQPTCFRM